MALPIVPILKRVAAAVVPKKKVVIFIVATLLGLVLIAAFPFIIVCQMLDGEYRIDVGYLEEVILQEQIEGKDCMMEIERQMRLSGHGDRVKEAQSLYLLALYDKSDEWNFVGRLVGCFKFFQSDKELIKEVNREFGMNVDHEEFTMVMEKVRNG